MLFQFLQHQWERNAFKSLLLGLAPCFRSLVPTSLCRRSQVFAHMKVVARECPLFAKYLSDLQSYPFRSIAHGVNADVLRPTCISGTILQNLPTFFHPLLIATRSAHLAGSYTAYIHFNIGCLARCSQCELGFPDFAGKIGDGVASVNDNRTPINQNAMVNLSVNG